MAYSMAQTKQSPGLWCTHIQSGKSFKSLHYLFTQHFSNLSPFTEKFGFEWVSCLSLSLQIIKPTLLPCEISALEMQRALHLLPPHFFKTNKLQLLYLRGSALSCLKWQATRSWAMLLLAREFLKLHKPERRDSSPQCWCFQAPAGHQQYVGELQKQSREKTHFKRCHPNNNSRKLW